MKTKNSLPKIKNKRRNKTRKIKKIRISSDFESGNCKVINISYKPNFVHIILTKKHEPFPVTVKRKYENWFYFKVTDCKNRHLKFDFKNLKFFQNNFNGYKACFSYDKKIWKRTPTTVKTNNILWDFTPKKNTVYFAYYVPYTIKRKNKLIKQMKKKPYTSHRVLGASPLQFNIDMLKIGKGDKHIFVIARQHPGETVGSFMAEGMLKEFFLPKHASKRKRFVKEFSLHIIPMANPDGVYLGHWYTDHEGCNLNRHWQDKKCEQNKIIYDEMGLNKYGSLYIDLHGDEGCENHFITQCSPDNKIYRAFNKIINKIDDKFQLKDYYAKERKNVKNQFGLWGTWDCKWLNGMTVEACMKHPIYKHNSLEKEILKVGSSLTKTMFRILHLL